MGLIEKNLERLPPIYNFIFSALSVVDTSMEAAESMTNIDVTDHDIMDKIMRIHGNKMPPKHRSQNIFRDAVTHLRGADRYFHERDAWRRQNLIKDN